MNKTETMRDRRQQHSLKSKTQKTDLYKFIKKYKYFKIYNTANYIS